MCSIVYDSEITSPPTYLDVAFFEEVVETAVRTACIKLKSIEFKMGSSAGDNYCSKIYRVKIKYENTENGSKPEEMAVIVKAILNLDGVKVLEDMQVYLKEKLTYYDVLPGLEILMRCKRRFGPKLYQCRKYPENALVFEDLSAHGFEMASREEGLNLEQARLVVESIAEFHAASMVLAKLDPKILVSYKSGMMSPQALADKEGMLSRHMANLGNAMHNLVNTWTGYEGIAKKIANYLNDQNKHLMVCQGPHDNDEIRVLNHGDLWVNNILFKYDESRKPTDVIFIDFQLGIWSSPGIDLNYFFYSSLNLEVLKEKRLHLLKLYHTRLAETLHMINAGIPVPTYEQIVSEVQRREPFGFVVNYGILPMLAQDKSETADNSIENLADDDFGKRKAAQMYTNARLGDTLRFTLKEFEKIGVF